jgi:hypothetical protein
MHRSLQITGFALLLLTLAPSARAAPAAPLLTDEFVARHALARADTAMRMGDCFSQQGAEVQRLAGLLLEEKATARILALRAALDAAHKELSQCLDLRPQGKPRCDPLPSAIPGNKSGIRPPLPQMRIQVQGEPPKALRKAVLFSLNKDRTELRRCYDRALSRDHALHGTIGVKLGMDPAGRLAQVQILSSSMANMGVTRCLLAKLQGLHGHPFGKAGEITLRFVFSHRK